MRGSIVGQVQALYRLSGISQIGCSKHRAKELARSSGAKTWHEIGKRLGIYSYSTADAYRDVWKQVLSFAKREFGVKDIEKLNAEIVHSFLHSKIEQSVSKRTFQQYAAAVEKLEVALNKYSEVKKSVVKVTLFPSAFTTGNATPSFDTSLYLTK